jgi:hypothetical protein
MRFSAGGSSALNSSVYWLSFWIAAKHAALSSFCHPIFFFATDHGKRHQEKISPVLEEYITSQCEI